VKVLREGYPVQHGINGQTIKISVISIGGKYKRLLYIIIRRNTLCWLLVHNIHRVGPRCILNDAYLAHPVTFGQSWSFLFLHLFSGSSCHRLSLFPRCEVWVSPRSSIVPCVSYFFLPLSHSLLIPGKIPCVVLPCV